MGKRLLWRLLYPWRRWTGRIVRRVIEHAKSTPIDALGGTE